MARVWIGEFAGGTDPKDVTTGWLPKLVFLWASFQGGYGGFSAGNYFWQGVAIGTAQNEANQFTERFGAEWNGSAFFGPITRRDRRAGEIISEINNGGITGSLAHISALQSTGFRVDFTVGNGSGSRYQAMAIEDD